MEKKISKIKKLRLKVLKEAKKNISDLGWNKKLLLKTQHDLNFQNDEISALFPNGYYDLLEMYLDEINNKMISESKKINLIRLRVHERIRELIILRLKIMSENKKMISKTFIFLLFPKNYKISLRIIYKTIDEIWFLSGDHSTDFNFYSKRIILASIYSAVMIHFINNNDLDKTIIFLDKQLKKVSKIPKLKNKINNIVDFLPKIYKLRKKFLSPKQ